MSFGVIITFINVYVENSYMKNNYKNFNFMNYIAAVILVILCIVQIVPDTSVKAETAENTGDITEIHTAAELVKASENQTGSYRLMADIDMTGIDWTPWDFSGKFDSNGYTILNLSVTKTKQMHNENIRRKQKRI